MFNGEMVYIWRTRSIICKIIIIIFKNADSQEK